MAKAKKPTQKKTKGVTKSRAQNLGLAEEASPFIDAPPATKNAQGQPLFKAADPIRTYDLTMTTVDARENFAELLNIVAYGTRRVVLTRRGKPLVCVIPMLDVDFIEELEDIVDGIAVDAAKKEQGDDPYIPHEELLKHYGIKF
jgi:prevent-host-death family protein